MSSLTIKIYRAKDTREMKDHVCVADMLLNKDPDQLMMSFLNEVYTRTENHFYEYGWFNEPNIQRFDTTAPLGTRSNMVGDIYTIPFWSYVSNRPEVLHYRIAGCGFEKINSLTDLPERNYL